MPDPLSSLLIATIITALVLALFWPDRGIFWRWQHSSQMSDRVLREDALIRWRRW